MVLGVPILKHFKVGMGRLAEPVQCVSGQGQ